MSQPKINSDSIDKIIKNEKFGEKVNRYLEQIFAYVDFIMQEEKRMLFIKTRYKDDVEEYQERVTALDKNRRIKHDAALSSISILNKIAVELNIDPVYSGYIDYDVETRGDIANAIIEFAKECLDKDKYGVIWESERNS